MDIVFGVPLLSRPDAFRESLGLFMEICPNRIKVDARDTFADTLAKARAEATLVRPHRQLSLTARQSRYETLLNFHPPSPIDFAGMPVCYELTTPLNLMVNGDEEGDNSSWETRESLTVQIHQHGEGRYAVGFDANAGVFDEPLLERALTHFITLVERCVAEPSTVVGSVDLLTFAERAALRLDAEVESTIDPATVAALVERVAATSPDRVALRHAGVTWTYTELMQRVHGLAAWFTAAGATEGCHIGVCVERSPDLVACLLAVMRVGAAYIPLDPSHPADRIELILEDSKPKLIVTDATGSVALGAAVDGAIRIDRDVPPTTPSTTPDRSQSTGIAYVIFTSGSTGRPKGVRVLHHGVSTFLIAMAERPGVSQDDCLLAVTTIAFDIAVLELFLPLIVSGTVVLAARADAMNPEAIESLLDEHDVTMMQATPATWHMLLQNSWVGRHSMTALVGGEALSPDLAEELLPRVRELWNMYGPTETTVWSTCCAVRRGVRPISIGTAIRGTRTYVLNDVGTPTPLGVAGELCIAGDGVAAGYHERPDLTADRFVPDPFVSTACARMYRTGDLVRVQDSGALTYIGRRDFQVKIRGYRIELGEIEAVLEGHPQVGQAVAVVRDAGQTSATLVAYVRPADADVDTVAIDAYLRGRLPAYMVPSRIAVINEFQLTPSGKVDRKRLPEIEEAAEGDCEQTWEPRNEFERSLRRHWHSVLGHRSFGPEDSFFEVGGHSLLALDLIHKLQDELGLNIDVGAVFRFPTLREQAQLATTGGASAESTVVPLQSSGAGAPIYGICGIHLYGELAKRLRPRRRFYGVYVPGEQFISAGVLRLQEISGQQLAAEYLRRIREHCPDGPFHLLGFCFGGMIAFEIARQAVREGLVVESVTLVDTALWTNLRRRQLKRIWNLLTRSRATGGVTAGEPVEAAAAPVDDRPVRLLERARTFVPSGRFDGRCILVRADDPCILETWKVTRLLGWEPFMGADSVVIPVTGEHAAILQPPIVDRIAAQLGKLL